MAEKSSFKDKLIGAFGLEDIDDDYDDTQSETYTEEETYYAQHPVETPAARRPAAPAPVQQADYAMPDVLVLDPETFDEAPGIVNKLKQNKTVVVNLKQTDFDEGRKIFDFLSGAVFALEGSLNRIAESVFILAPQHVSVSTQMEEPSGSDQEYTTKILNWEE